MDAIQLGISTSYRWVSGQRRDRPVPDFQGRDHENENDEGNTAATTTTTSYAAYRTRLGLMIPTPDGSGRVSPDPTLSSSVPPSTPTRHTPLSQTPIQPRQYVVHDVSAGRRTSAASTRSRSRSRSASSFIHSHTNAHTRSRSEIGSQSLDTTNQHQPPFSGNDAIPTVSTIPTPVIDETKERLRPSQPRQRSRKSRRSPLSSLLTRPSRTRGQSKPSTKSSSSSSHPLKFPFTNFVPSMVLENSGSVARDHLASERTFLAYVRTSLALASTGVAIVQLFTIADLTSKSTGVALSSASKRMQRFARPLGVTMVVLGLVVLGIAVYRYFLVQRTLPEKNFPVARFSVAFISFVLGAAVVVVFGALLGGRVSG